jgi:type IV secretion system protein VirB10
MMVLSIAFVIVIGGGLLINFNKDKKKKGGDEGAGAAARAPAEFLRNQRDRALSSRNEDTLPPEAELTFPETTELPVAYRDDRPPAPPPPPSPPSGGRGGGADLLPAAYRSSLVPRTIEGSIFGARQRQEPSGTYAEQYPYSSDGQARNAADEYQEYQRRAAGSAVPGAAAAAAYQNDKQSFYDSGGGGGTITNGRFLGDSSLWIGTIVPGILETGINTDLPGNVIARVTQNVYDSRTGKKLLIPQGSILVARYNDSVSYAQHRVQIVWDTLIRPDGFQIDLEGMNGVDRKGLSGQAAEYHENWFEYLKAAGIIMMFSVANSKMTEEAAKYTAASTAAGIAQANSEFVNQMGGNIVARAMNIQPTLTVENGTLINIMLNKTIYLPPVEDFPVTKKYTLR